MNCYFCQRAGISTAAVAICRSCGAACCIDHLKERNHAGHSAGMQPMSTPRAEILCERCLALQFPHLASARPNVAESADSSTTLKARSAPTLPDAKEAINTVKELLSRERAAQSAERRKGWRRFFGRLRLSSKN